MANKNNEINEIAARIISISALYKSNKDFLDACGITNHSLITDLKKKRIKYPGADILAKIVNETGCNGSWLLTGNGEMFTENSDFFEEKEAGYIIIKGAINLIEEFEERIQSIGSHELTDELELKLAKLMINILERRGYKSRYNS